MNNDQSKTELAEKKTPGVDGSIRIKSGLRISVNDAGDEIFLPVENTQFVENFYEMLDLWWGTAATSDEFQALVGNRSFPTPSEAGTKV